MAILTFSARMKKVDAVGDEMILNAEITVDTEANGDLGIGEIQDAMEEIEFQANSGDVLAGALAYRVRITQTED